MLLIREPSSLWWRTPSDELRQYLRLYNARPEVHAKRLARQKAYYWRHRERRIGAQRTVNYGCTPDEYSAMFLRQQGRCAICRRAETRQYKGRVRNLAVDHDHETGKIRALLCGACNIGIGAFYHDPTRLRAARAYLRFHGDVVHSPFCDVPNRAGAGVGLGLPPSQG